ncbi:hypothetical protein AVEN_128181-1 [Araneus ventricosus]|uniref:Uncharacterized protein n=1 Tax=Araneus ventricosus TaxID=182803 RepID=A0A4Y1ZZT6_ARAVE|nr:hypothetical protein AVEN_128181-1 [Araneus ventricosus]
MLNAVSTWWYSLSSGIEGSPFRLLVPPKIRRVRGPGSFRSCCRESNILMLVRYGITVRGMPIQLMSLSFDHGSKLRDPLQNSLRFASSQDENT